MDRQPAERKTTAFAVSAERFAEGRGKTADSVVAMAASFKANWI
jgi:hypothetical protein